MNDVENGEFWTGCPVFTDLWSYVLGFRKTVREAERLDTMATWHGSSVVCIRVLGRTVELRKYRWTWLAMI
jgi:hypothetical protein